ncbi:hypothetical protein N7492_006611 [Penicillium capsulatum]|uniref:PWI domain-containing protein n=1 Tax=Penicillium capsulatum TaxID=69766 RepID=A0A9W9HY95_9EURO|nr:hypothetical protein N7492_006611 [Penicillium capsulatum]
MATPVDAKLLRQTKFPPEFSRKVDMTKVNIEVIKKWIASRISQILGNEDDVIIELCFNLLEASRYPDIKALQIQLTGFLDKDTSKFCKELWSLCLSGQENPQGVPKELLEAKKLELMQEKLYMFSIDGIPNRRTARSKPKKLPKPLDARRNKTKPASVTWRICDGESVQIVDEADVVVVTMVLITTDEARGLRHPGIEAGTDTVNPHLVVISILTSRPAVIEAAVHRAPFLVPVHLPDLLPVRRVGTDMTGAIDLGAAAAAPLVDLRRPIEAAEKRGVARTTVIDTDPLSALHHAHELPEETEADGVLSPAA